MSDNTQPDDVSGKPDRYELAGTEGSTYVDARAEIEWAVTR